MPDRTGSSVTIAGRPLTCVVCGADRFTYREVKLTTTGLTFFDLDWLNRSGTGAICERCGYLHTFVDSGLLEWA
jgi:predicted nucleic-acid-binding Zn-ribbon protein